MSSVLNGKAERGEGRRCGCGVVGRTNSILSKSAEVSTRVRCAGEAEASGLGIWRPSAVFSDPSWILKLGGSGLKAAFVLCQRLA
jgi:hypothetical protein